VTDFPTIMYKTPGPHRKTGGTYDIIGADDLKAFNANLAKGWFPSFEDALADKSAKKIIEAAESFDDSIDEVSGPVRDELEQKAEELGIGFNKRTSDKKLAERIAAALEG